MYNWRVLYWIMSILHISISFLPSFLPSCVIYCDLNLFLLPFLSSPFPLPLSMSLFVGCLWLGFFTLRVSSSNGPSFIVGPPRLLSPLSFLFFTVQTCLIVSTAHVREHQYIYINIYIYINTVFFLFVCLFFCLFVFFLVLSWKWGGLKQQQQQQQNTFQWVNALRVLIFSNLSCRDRWNCTSKIL